MFSKEQTMLTVLNQLPYGDFADHLTNYKSLANKREHMKRLWWCKQMLNTCLVQCWCLDRCNSRAHKLSNYVNIPELNSDMLWCFFVSLWHKKKSARSRKEVVQRWSGEYNKKKVSHLKCLVRKQVKVKSQNLTKGLVCVLITYSDTKSPGLSQLSHKIKHNPKESTVILKKKGWI